MIDISFVQDNLPSSEEQLKLLTNSLRNRNDTFNFNLISKVDRAEKLMYKIGAETKFSCKYKYLVDFKSKKNYLTYKVESIIRQLIIGIVTYSKERQYQTLNILKPEALLEKTYISFVEREEEIYLVGIIGIYFDN